jgi:hypothetical protein
MVGKTKKAEIRQETKLEPLIQRGSERNQWTKPKGQRPERLLPPAYNLE